MKLDMKAVTQLLQELSQYAGLMVNGNKLSARAQALLAGPPAERASGTSSMSKGTSAMTSTATNPWPSSSARKAAARIWLLTWLVQQSRICCLKARRSTHRASFAFATPMSWCR